jgi:hypothetical protein
MDNFNFVTVIVYLGFRITKFIYDPRYFVGYDIDNCFASLDDAKHAIEEIFIKHSTPTYN